jgi:hypothetical protein
LVAVIACAQVPAAQHVVLVIDENSTIGQVMANMPWLVAQGHANGYAANYASDNGGSLLDYLWLASGSCHSAANCTLPTGTHDFNCNGNNCYYPGTNTSDEITDNNIFRELNNAGISWKVYAQSYAQAGGTVTTPDNNNWTSYYRRHNGATWYSDILDNVDGSASKIVDLWQLTVDVANGTLPRFMIIVPDGNHDAHDCPVGMLICTEPQKLDAADRFLRGTLDPILSTPDFQPGGTGLLVITFDECAPGTNWGCAGSVYTALIGPQVAPHTVSMLPYKHENTLRTVLHSLGIRTYPGAAATAAAMSDFFVTSGNRPEVIVNSPASGASLRSPVSVKASAFPTAGHFISGWHVYVDSVLKYSAGAVDSIQPSLPISNGTHTILVQTWDNSGAYNYQFVSLTVTSLKPVVTVSTPFSTANVGLLANIKATAAPTAGHSIGKWHIYVDGNAVYNAGPVNAIDTTIAMGVGTHKVVVLASDTSGAYADRTLYLTASNKPTVALSAPVTGSNVISAIGIHASGTPSPGHSISGWSVYLDGAMAYHAGAADSIDAGIPAVSGSHTLTVRVWDSSGAYGDQTVSARVRPVAVNITTPVNYSAVTSPVNIVARASSAHHLSGWQIYVDSIASYTQDSGPAIDANLPMSPGTHTVVVRAWDSTGAFGDETIKVTVP